MMREAVPAAGFRPGGEHVLDLTAGTSRQPASGASGADGSTRGRWPPMAVGVR